MVDPQSTRWTLVRGAADGEAAAREEFARLYEPVVRACLFARWKRSPLIGQADDAVQDVFLDCLRESGPLQRAVAGRAGGFRAFLRGVTRNIARRHEERHARRREMPAGSRVDLGALQDREEALSVAFDRAWAKAIVREAAALHEASAREKGGAAPRRVELLHLRFGEGLPIREIARLRNEDPARTHTDYARARVEFEVMLREVLRVHHPEREVDAECARLLDLFG